MENEKISKNLKLLLLSFIIGISFMVVTHLVFTHFIDRLNTKTTNVKNRLKIDKMLANDVYKIRSSYFELSVTTRNKRGREIILKRIKKIEKDMINAIKVLQNGGVLIRKIRLNVVGHKSMIVKIPYKNSTKELPLESIDILPKLQELNHKLNILIKTLKNRELAFNGIKQRDKVTPSKIKFLIKEVKIVRINNKKAPAFFDRMYENIQRMVYEGNIKLKKLNKNFIKNRFLYESLELLIIILTITVIFVFVYILTNQINSIGTNLAKRVQEEVEKSRQKDRQLLQQSRLAQMGEMLSMIAHQWRQPLSAISAVSGTIKLKAQLGKLDKEKAMEYAGMIGKYAQHLSSTIDDFRDFFKSKKEKKRASFDELVNSVMNIVEVSIRNKNITIEKDLNQKDMFLSYPNELKQVILNLVKNAEDVLIEKDIKDPKICIKTYKNGDKYILEVKDNAGGISEDILDKIFDPYFSTKSKKDGTGLGLYMSKIIIEEHCRGKLTAKNGQDGAVFIITIE